MLGNSVSRTYHIFPGKIHIFVWERLTDRPLELNAQHLYVYLRKHQGGRRMTGPLYWACAQSQYGIRPRACMGLG